jgi:hypothetical protein
MGLTDIPTSFGSSFFIRTFFPASIATAIYSITFYDVLKNSFWFLLSFENKILVLIIISLLIGVLLNICDAYIYKFYEGIWGWPNCLKRFFHNRQIEKFKKLDDELEATRKQIKDEKDENLRWSLNEKLSQLSAELRKFPYNPDYSSYTQRYPERPTEFGNVIAEYELYSEKQYGMHMMVFWQHLWQILPKESRDDLDLRSAKADFNVYVSFIFLTFAFIGTTMFIFQSNTYYKIFYWSIPLKPLISAVISLFGWYVFYKLSISEHKVYGRYIKAVFDLYRFDLAKKLHIKVSEFPEIEKKSWEIRRNFFLDYRLPEK